MGTILIRDGKDLVIRFKNGLTARQNNLPMPDNDRNNALIR